MSVSLARHPEKTRIRGSRIYGADNVFPMEVVDLGDSGLRVSRVGLGCNNFGGRIDLDATRAVVDAALDVGITFFDTAEVYGNGWRERALPRGDPRGSSRPGRACDEVRLGAGLWTRRRRQRPGVRSTARSRDCGRITSISTTCTSPIPRHRSPRRSVRSTSSSPRARCVRSGARTSRRSSSLRRIASRASRAPLASPSSRTTTACSSATTTRTSCRSAASLGVAYIPYFPLASGLLTGKYRRGEPAPEGTRLAGREIEDERLARVEALAALRGAAGPQPSRPRDLGAGLDARHRLGHRGRHEARAGESQCRGCLLAPRGRRARRPRSALTTRYRTLTPGTEKPHAPLRYGDRGNPPKSNGRESENGEASCGDRDRRGRARVAHADRSSTRGREAGSAQPS